MTDFQRFGLPEALLNSLIKMGYTTATPIQEQAIPLAMEGKDILGSAQTGTGKTAAFGVPLIAKLTTSSRGAALVLTPTRELAVQVMEILKQLIGPYSTLRTALLIGGESMPAQINQLRSRPRVIVGTPGRINDHLARGTLMLNDVAFLVLDETDRMLDMGFAPQLEQMVKYLPKQRQTLMFSATFPANIMQLAGKYLNMPERISVGESHKAHVNIKQDIIHTTHEEKYDMLMKELDSREGSVIIFVKTKFGAERLADRLSRSKHRAEAIHGNLQQRKRERVISGFRESKYRILVATDIASRGLDIPHIAHVINFDLPQCPEDYIHRIGRTARAGAEGSSLCLIAPDDMRKWKAIERMMNPHAAPGKDTPNAHSDRPQSKKRFGGRPFRRTKSSGERQAA